MRARTLVNVGLSLVVAGLFLYLAARNVSIDQLHDSFRHFEAWWLVPAVALSLLLQVLRTFRWQIELLPLEEIPFGRLWVVTSIAYMAINLLPARLGEVVRPWLLSRRSGVSFSSAVGNLIFEKTMDSVALVFYILLGLMTATNLPPAVRHGAVVPALVAAALVALVLLLWWRGEDFVRRRIAAFLPDRFAARLMRILRAVVSGMQILPRANLVGAVFVVSMTLWFVPILSSYVMIRAFEFGLPFSAALVVFICIGAATALPQGPAMVGTFQYACVFALHKLFGVAEADALAYGIVLNALQVLTLVGQGVAAQIISGVSVDEILRARSVAAAAERRP